MNKLEKIVAAKRKLIDGLIDLTKTDLEHPLNQILKKDRPSQKLFSSSLKKPYLAVISEIKRASPSLGEIRKIEKPVDLALQYCQGGASAISVLTDSHFQGALEDLHEVSQAIPLVPTMRKDFILHPLQLAEAVQAGAQAVLLIAHVVDKDLRMLLQEAERLGLEALTEIHDFEGLEIALKAEAPIIGINHRNLKTFEMDLSTSERLRPLIPKHVITVAESGIHDHIQAKHIRELGFDAILVGEALVRSNNPSELIRLMRGDTA